MYIPDHINLSFNPDVLRTGGQKINDNFDAISYEIDAAIAGLAAWKLAKTVIRESLPYPT